MCSNLDSIPSLPLLVEKECYPYTIALMFFQINQGSLSAGQEKLLYADVFSGKIAKIAPVIENEKINVNFDYGDLSYIRMLFSNFNKLILMRKNLKNV